MSAWSLPIHCCLTPNEVGLILTLNADPRPFVWTKTADEILGALAAYCRRASGHA